MDEKLRRDYIVLSTISFLGFHLHCDMFVRSSMLGFARSSLKTRIDGLVLDGVYVVRFDVERVSNVNI